jgi:hypothetical protein
VERYFTYIFAKIERYLLKDTIKQENRKKEREKEKEVVRGSATRGPTFVPVWCRRCSLSG